MRLWTHRILVWGLIATGGCIEQNPDWLASQDETSSSTTTTTGAVTTTTESEGSTGVTASTTDATETGTPQTETGTPVEPRRIFVSAGIHTGNLGGRAGGDALCQGFADAAALEGTWRVLLSTTSQSAAEALALAGPLVNLGGEVVAQDGADLWDETLEHAVGFDEQGNPSAGRALTGTHPDGSAAADLCEDWTTQVGGSKAVLGLASSTSGTWVDNESGACSQSFRMYCVEDPP